SCRPRTAWLYRTYQAVNRHDRGSWRSCSSCLLKPKQKSKAITALPDSSTNGARCLTFGVGRGLARAFETGLLAFLHTRVAGEIIAVLQLRLQIGVELQQCASNTEPHRITLAADTAALHPHCDIIAAILPYGAQRFQQQFQIAKAREVFTGFLVIDDNIA